MPALLLRVNKEGGVFFAVEGADALEIAPCLGQRGILAGNFYDIGSLLNFVYDTHTVKLYNFFSLELTLLQAGDLVLLTPKQPKVPELADKIAALMESKNVTLADLLLGLEEERKAIWQERQQDA